MYDIIVVGAGRIAKRRIETLLQFVPSLTVIAPEVHPDLLPLEAAGKLRVLRKSYISVDLDGADLVLAATNSPEVNDEVWRDCRSLGIPVNVSSDKNKCDFYFPGIARRGNVVIGVTSGGEDHAEAKRLVLKLRRLLGSH